MGGGGGGGGERGSWGRGKEDSLQKISSLEKMAEKSSGMSILKYLL